MLPSSHEAVIGAQPAQQGALLAAAFSDFIAASSRLELSYRDLQAEVAELSATLYERNRALSESVCENQHLSKRLQHILETIPCGVMVVRDDGSLELANPEAARLLELSTTQASVVATPAAEPYLQLEPQAPFAGAGAEEEQEFCFETPEGHTWVAVRRVDLPATGDVVRGKVESVLTLRDISTWKRMEEEREAARDAVALAQISALLAHEIRNPLASLELFAGLVQDNSERRDEWLSHLRAGIRSLSGTVNNVLTLHGNIPLLLEHLDVVHEATLAVNFMQPLAQQAQVSLTLDAGSAAEVHAPKVRGNRSAFHQILLNLCSNALRHTPADGIVEVACHAPLSLKGPFAITVSDTGCGIPSLHIPELFKVGFSGSGTTSGLGLAVCDRLVRQLGGTLHVKSRVGHGSTFTLELPQA